ncbi:MAG: hypothetical protein QOH49_2488, partial [Acidobacteriota bacterium]|nr:hypothetical protein [Acidobacteriota bacterium]
SAGRRVDDARPLEHRRGVQTLSHLCEDLAQLGEACQLRRLATGRRCRSTPPPHGGGRGTLPAAQRERGTADGARHFKKASAYFAQESLRATRCSKNCGASIRSAGGAGCLASRVAATRRGSATCHRRLTRNGSCGNRERHERHLWRPFLTTHLNARPGHSVLSARPPWSDRWRLSLGAARPSGLPSSRAAPGCSKPGAPRAGAPPPPRRR